MPFRDRFKKAFRRPEKEKDTKPKIEYYRRGECPRSKYRGPVDPEHKRRLYDWNFADATADRRRSFDLDLSPCTSLPDNADDDSDLTTDQESESEVAQKRMRSLMVAASITVAHHEVAPCGSVDSTSDSSTAVASSYGSSTLTLKESWDWPLAKRDAMATLKESIALTTAPLARRISAPEKAFHPEQLRRALSSVRDVY
ncbi:hypothetical protein BGW36DRAFT_308619 [Talaromyces proteolyticus]|uniref:Uncharacterized protein n=1 Tax=Talaromyces proteolyticus TaxID=1131652 RepID=A0AAD4KFW7_9EURO|nr:uncharacterized protein BGW36DRAFT_308619 [Talaromyces proteolyticus]KAH8689426.1 hypothetical protein BGW36DRAFT_308619 [Talaromyces proteolyticus]